MKVVGDLPMHGRLPLVREPGPRQCPLCLARPGPLAWLWGKVAGVPPHECDRSNVLGADS